jgi:hypothetical protein
MLWKDRRLWLHGDLRWWRRTMDFHQLYFEVKNVDIEGENSLFLNKSSAISEQ